jgi:chemotaxis response regulator CheB
MIKVLIVEDHPIVREGVITVLERERDIDVVGAAGTIGEGLRLAGKLNPDVVLLDYGLEGHDSLAITATAHKLACVIYHMLKYKEEYVPLDEAVYELKAQERRMRHLRKQAEDLGYELIERKQAA